ncbi:MAG: GGDEF domain-containing protein [Gammaproteobacteria bacterium]|nr:GGDEF domain-containing protein [Gammaproteobacteria bacterium]
MILPRITKTLFLDLAIWMVGFGLLIGATFPLFALMLGIRPEHALNLRFYLATLGAGLAAGGLNFLLARLVVRPRLGLLGQRMHVVADAIRQGTYDDDQQACTVDQCLVDMDSTDELGEAAGAFNGLVRAIFRSYEVESAVSDFSRVLSSELDVQPLATLALDQLMGHTGAGAGAVLVNQGGALTVVASHGLVDTTTLAASDHVRRALRSGRIVTLHYPPALKLEALLAEFAPLEAYVTPIDFKTTPLGVVVLATAQPFSPDACKLLELFRQSFGVALNNALAHHDMKRLAALDALTGTYNRRFGLSRLREEFKRAVRSKSPLGVMMADIDHFKPVNDTYGHLVGDRVLISVTQTLRQGLRDGDVLVRWGGEEFLVILPGGSIDDCRQVAERIRQRVKETRFTDEDQTFHVTLSIGVASYPETDVEEEQRLVGLADDALYAAKHQGRDRVVTDSGIEPRPTP